MDGSLTSPPSPCRQSTSLEVLKKHFGTRHVSRSALVCGRCDQSFPRLEALQYHMRRQHHGQSAAHWCGRWWGSECSNGVVAVVVVV